MTWQSPKPPTAHNCVLPRMLFPLGRKYGLFCTSNACRGGEWRLQYESKIWLLLAPCIAGCLWLLSRAVKVWVYDLRTYFARIKTGFCMCSAVVWCMLACLQRWGSFNEETCEQVTNDAHIDCQAHNVQLEDRMQLLIHAERFHGTVSRDPAERATA